MVLLKNGNGDRVDNPNQVRRIIDNHFIDLFTLTGQQDWGDILNCITPKVTDEINESLTNPILVEEIKDATMQMGGSKGPRTRWLSSYILPLLLGHHSKGWE